MKLGFTAYGKWIEPAFLVTNIQEFGADPTGLRDSSQAIIEAVECCSDTGAIEIPPGTYKFIRPMITSDGLRISGGSGEQVEYQSETKYLGKQYLKRIRV